MILRIFARDETDDPPMRAIGFQGVVERRLHLTAAMSDRPPRARRGASGFSRGDP